MVMTTLEFTDRKCAQAARAAGGAGCDLIQLGLETTVTTAATAARGTGGAQ